MATIAPTFCHFDHRKIANWSTTQEKSISQDYPLHLHDEPLEQYVQRTYLQFLWLPFSLMPLHLLVPSLRRVNVPSTSDPDASPHPMHALLGPLLLTPRAATDKYHVELPRILINGGGAGEMEETMMWYAVAHERIPDTLVLPEHAEGPWADEKWREAYLERMERREVQIQILLHLYTLSLPGPLPHVKKPRKRTRHPVEPVLTPEEHLEAFMDKLCMWQLVGSLDRGLPAASSGGGGGGGGRGKTDERDWTQVFAEDIVERYFKPHLPDLCALLRSKLFPSSPFSDDDDDDILPTTQPTSQPAPPNPTRRPLSRAPSARLPSPTTSSSSHIATGPSSHITTTRTTTSAARTTSSTTTTTKSRARSLSLSLAHEQAERARASVAPPKRRVLNREVSMSRVFKPRPKPAPRPSKPSVPPAPHLPNASKAKAVDGDGAGDVVLVEDTPQKPRAASSASLSFSFGVGRQPSFGPPKMRALSIPKALEEEEDGDEWTMDSSPNIVLLNPPRSSSVSSALTGLDEEDEEEEEGEGEVEEGDHNNDDVDMGEVTPSRPSRARRR